MDKDHEYRIAMAISYAMTVYLKHFGSWHTGTKIRCRYVLSITIYNQLL